MGIFTVLAPVPATKTFSNLSPEETANACQELLLDSHRDYHRSQQLYSVLQYYFLLRALERTGVPSSPGSPAICDAPFCLYHCLTYPFHNLLFKALQDRAKRFRTQRKGKAGRFNCYAAPITYWVVQIMQQKTDAKAVLTLQDDPKEQERSKMAKGKGILRKRTKVQKDSSE
ncbi:hypothetical protein GOP47_0026828 [Adiantum capillus-veneris]|nr:hypothetical protein GOP47_0026828 [Adiantum capillus-veneris]